MQCSEGLEEIQRIAYKGLVDDGNFKHNTAAIENGKAAL